MFKQFLGEQKICEGKSKLGGYFQRFPAIICWSVRQAHSHECQLVAMGLSHTPANYRWKPLKFFEVKRVIPLHHQNEDTCFV